MGQKHNAHFSKNDPIPIGMPSVFARFEPMVVTMMTPRISKKRHENGPIYDQTGVQKMSKTQSHN